MLNVDAPYDRLEALARELWLPAVINSAGRSQARLEHLSAWRDALLRGELPDANLDFGDPRAVHALRREIGALNLPALARDAAPVALQVLRTMLWHLDRLIDRSVDTPRSDAIEHMARAFRDEWDVQRSGWDEVIALLQGLGDLAWMSSDALAGRLNSREWLEAQRIAALIARLPELAALIRKLGRGVPREHGGEPAVQPAQRSRERVPVVVRETVLHDAPGDVRGVRPGRSLARMVASQAAQLRHPVLHKLWRAALAESRLLVWDEQAVLVEHVSDPRARSTARAAAVPAPRERGPFIVCVDTSGSMKGAPENVAKAVVLEAARTAHRERRACKLVAFGGPEEIVQHDLAFTPNGLDALLTFIGQAFDGGTDIEAPIGCAVQAVLDQGWHEADLLLVTDGEFGATPASLARLDEARTRRGLRVQGVLIGDRETMGLLDTCDAIAWVRDWRRYAWAAEQAYADGFTPVHSKSLTALYFPNALSTRAKRHHA
jgi:uncharacterized protein with von Willebrand factor type A (vWA) domain